MGAGFCWNVGGGVVVEGLGVCASVFFFFYWGGGGCFLLLFLLFDMFKCIRYV